MRKAILLSTLLLVSCTVGPNYRRPDVQAPANFRGASFDQLSTPSTTSLADTKWFDLFKDDVLKQLITTAIAGNFDLRIAAERIMQSRSELGEQR
jgi:outer membrane protein TolC